MGVNLQLGIDHGECHLDGTTAEPNTVISLDRDYRLHAAISELAVDCDCGVEWPNEETGAGNHDGPGQYVLAGRLKELDLEDLDDMDPGLGTTAWNAGVVRLLAGLPPEERVYLCWG